jgi:hypothetical protein
VRQFLEDFYRDRFDQIHILTPPEGVGEPSSPAVTHYYQGSYNFAGAFSHLLQQPDLFAGLDWITVLHDDVMLNPAYRRLIEPRLAARPDFLAPAPWPDAEMETWLFNWRIVSRAFLSKDPILGDGPDDPLRALKQLHASSKRPRAKSKQVRLGALNLLHPGGKGAATRKFFYRHRSLTADFGVPLLAGNSDFFIIRRDRFARFCHDAGVLSLCGLFAEVAVPTALDWLAERPAFFSPDQLAWDYRGGFERIAHLDGIAHYFQQHPEKVAFHPIKLSRLLP